MATLQERLLASPTSDIMTEAANRIDELEIKLSLAKILSGNAAEIIDTLTSKLDSNHPIVLSAKNRAKNVVAELYQLEDDIDVSCFRLENTRSPAES